nr:putative copia-type protein [Tanacetum cinerariifolium]
MISEVSSSQTNNLDNPQPDNLDENNADDIQDSTSDILQEHEEEVPRKLYSKEIPSSFEQALKSEKWKKAMDDEMKALKKNKIWDQCALPQEKKPVGCWWIFTVKYKPDGTVERYKARSKITKRDIHLSEKVVDLLAEIGMINCKPADTPMMVNQKLFMEKKANWLIETGGNLVTWRSKKQKVASLSSAKAEFRGSTQIMCNNKAAIQILENPVHHDRTKHVEVDRHFIKQKLEAVIIELPFVKSSDQLADILTKAVGTDIFHKCLSKLNFRNSTIQLEGEC